MTNDVKTHIDHEFDIVISGGGIAGSMMALELQHSGLRVALLEAQAQVQPVAGVISSVNDVTPRVSALSQASCDSLERLGVWNLLDTQRLCSYRDMAVWDAQGNARVEFSASDVAVEQLGCIVENNHLIATLQTVLADATTTIFQEVMLQKFDRDELENRWRLSLSNGQILTTKLLIAADGARSFIRTSLNIPTREWDYDHHAVVATVETQQAHQSTAWQRFLQTGPLAFLPLACEQKNLSSIVWSLPPEKAQEMMQLDEDAFKKQLGLAFELHLGKITQVSKRFSFPLRQCHAVDYVQDGLALIADAAHAIHPLAGQGINLGIQDVRVLAQEILKAQANKIDWASEDILLRYQRRRKVHNLGMMAVVEGFSKLYASDNLSFGLLRNIGMRFVSNNKRLKKQLIKRAVGIN